MSQICDYLRNLRETPQLPACVWFSAPLQLCDLCDSRPASGSLLRSDFSRPKTSPLMSRPFAVNLHGMVGPPAWPRGWIEQLDRCNSEMNQKFTVHSCWKRGGMVRLRGLRGVVGYWLILAARMLPSSEAWHISIAGLSLRAPSKADRLSTRHKGLPRRDHARDS